MRVEGGAELIAMMQRSNAQSRLRQQSMHNQQHPSAQQQMYSNAHRRPSYPSSAGAGTGTGQSNEPVDLGIMKALNTMGTATKQSLSQLAQAFKSKTPASGTNNSSSSSDVHSSSTSSTAGGHGHASSSPQQSIRSPKQQPKAKRGSKNFQSLEDQELNHEVSIIHSFSSYIQILILCIM